MFRIEIMEVESPQPEGVGQCGVQRYCQTVDVIDLPKIIAAINARPRKARTLAPKKETKA